MEIDIDPTTGGIRAVRGSGEDGARVGQQIVIVGVEGDVPSRMRGERFEVEFGGPALVQAISEGALLHPTADYPLARFRQRVRLWAGVATAEIRVELSDLDPALIDALAAGDPWRRFLSCRWAWPDAAADLRRTHFLSPEVTTSLRPETPDVLDIPPDASARPSSSAAWRTTGGKAHACLTPPRRRPRDGADV